MGLNSDELDFLDRAERAIEAGNPYAMVDWASFYSVEHPELITDEITPKIIKYFNEGIKEDIPKAYLNLGAMYYDGRYVKQNYETALSYYEVAAESDEDDISKIALTNIGYYYMYHAKDYKSAADYFMKAFSRNDATAAYKIGDMYAKGLFFSKDEKTAFYYYKIALKLCDNDTTAGSILKRLGTAIYYGRGCEKDLKEALLHLTRAEGLLMQSALKGESFAKERLKDLEIVLAKAKAEFSKRENKEDKKPTKVKELILADSTILN